ncbi:MAG: hypothetical protein HC869_13910 [Rhodospirillales bacterium]|nr:hypothetical protein [Rhodospirillales bacterium]
MEEALFLLDPKALTIGFLAPLRYVGVLVISSQPRTARTTLWAAALDDGKLRLGTIGCDAMAVQTASVQTA